MAAVKRVLKLLGIMLLGALMGYLSLAAGVTGIILAAAIPCLFRLWSRRREQLAGYLVGLGSVGAWVLHPSITNTDPAIRYVSGLDVAMVIVYVLLAALGVTSLVWNWFGNRNLSAR
ncbi:MAG: hypothetical protein JOZ41_11950 [Chloroflexi bacterium]|nr:hypothetical protein [Chloroflexota bacterium]